MKEERIVAGVDVGGTHISCALVDVENEKTIWNTHIDVPINSGGSAFEILDVFRGVIKELCSFEKKPVGIGVAMPGPFDYANGICLMKGVGKYDSIYGVNLKELFAEASGLGSGNIIFMNDAACFAMGEYYAGAGRGCSRMAAITLGTGFGSAFMSDGKIITEGTFVPEGGMFWNIPYKDGIADDYFSTRWFVDNYYKQTGKKINGVADLMIHFKNDKPAQIIFNEFAQSIAWFMMPWLKLFETERLIIGGSIAKAEEFFVPLMQYTFADDGYDIDVRLTKLGFDAAIIGSANLFK